MVHSGVKKHRRYAMRRNSFYTEYVPSGEKEDWWAKWCAHYHNRWGKLDLVLPPNKLRDLVKLTKPPAWLKKWMYQVPIELWGTDRIDNLMTVILCYLWWRHEMSMGDKKYKLYTTKQGMFQEFHRLKKMCAVDGNDRVSERTLAVRYMLTGMDRLWAGLPRPGWVGTNELKQITVDEDAPKIAAAKPVAMPVVTDEQNTEWSRIVRSIGSTGHAPEGVTTKLTNKLGMDATKVIYAAYKKGDKQELQRLRDALYL